MQMKKQNWNNIFGSVAAGFVLALIFQLSALNSFSELTATVSPGYTFSSTERADNSKLNRLGLPTITITGTLDGTNAGISAGSINGNMFASTVVDDATIYFTNSSPQAIAIKAAGVGPREISSNIAGPGLTGGSGYALTNNVDAVSITVTNDVVTLATNLNPGHLLVASNSVVVGGAGSHAEAQTPLKFATNVFPGFTFTGSVALSSISAKGKYIDTAHGLGVTPKSLHAALVCTTAEFNYAVGDELDFGNVWQSGGTSPAGTPWANSTNVGVTMIVSAASFQIPNKTTGDSATPTSGSWTLKIYARP